MTAAYRLAISVIIIMRSDETFVMSLRKEIHTKHTPNNNHRTTYSLYKKKGLSLPHSRYSAFSKSTLPSIIVLSS